MKYQLKNTLNWSRKERVGILCIISLILLIQLFSFYLSSHSKVPIDLKEIALNEAWERMQVNQKNDFIATNHSSRQARLVPFDPNELDSAGFIRLGLNPKCIHYLLNWRLKGKHFYKKEDLKPLYALSEQEYERIAPYIRIAPKAKQTNPYAPIDLSPLPESIPLNQTDSATLVRLNGIGSILAHKIIERRAALGGFIHHEQLLELYHFPDTTYTYLKKKLNINPNTIKKININTATEQELSQHPYIGEKMAKNIVLLRSGLNKYENLSQLRQVPLMNEEKYRKIAAYCTID